MTLMQRYLQIQKIGTEVTVPYEVWVCLHERPTSLHIIGEQVQLGYGDFVSIEQARAALNWYVTQLGGSVKWQKEV